MARDPGSRLIACAAGDKLFVEVFQDSGGTLATAPTLTMLSADWRRA